MDLFPKLYKEIHFWLMETYTDRILSTCPGAGGWDAMAILLPIKISEEIEHIIKNEFSLKNDIKIHKIKILNNF